MYQDREYLPRGINNYVPAMGYASDVIHGSPTLFSFGTPDDETTLVDAIKTDFDTTAAGESTDIDGDAPYSDARYGRCVAITGTGATVFTITGRDYLSQPMVEEITLTDGAGEGNKAFFWIDRIEWDDTGGGAGTTVGWSNKLGMPYKTSMVHTELADGSPEADTGTLVAGDVTDPQTATTDDPRGTYAPNVALDGETEVAVFGIFSNWINPDGNGGLHGVKHYFG